VHAAWLLSLWVFGWDHPVNWRSPSVYLRAGLSRLVMGRRRAIGRHAIIVLGQAAVSAGPIDFCRIPITGSRRARSHVIHLVLGMPVRGHHLTVAQRRVIAVRINAFFETPRPSRVEETRRLPAPPWSWARSRGRIRSASQPVRLLLMALAGSGDPRHHRWSRPRCRRSRMHSRLSRDADERD